MEELKKELEKLSKAYVDTPENEEKILIPFIYQEIIGVANEGQAEVAAAYPGIAMDKRQVRWFQQ